MKFLIDNALSPIISKGLNEVGFESVHVRDIGMHSAPDIVIFQQALQNEQIIVSADADFGTLLALKKYTKPSVILFRCTDKRPYSLLSLLKANLPEIKDPLTAGSIVVFEDSRIRIRALPIG